MLSFTSPNNQTATAPIIYLLLLLLSIFIFLNNLFYTKFFLYIYLFNSIIKRNIDNVIIKEIKTENQQKNAKLRANTFVRFVLRSRRRHYRGIRRRRRHYHHVNNMIMLLFVFFTFFLSGFTLYLVIYKAFY